MPAPRVLCYAPYNRWALHGRWEMTILHGLRLRGAEVDYVLCDGLYTDCDQYWAAATGPRPANACVGCQADVTRLVAEMGMDFRWLGRYLRSEEEAEARRWAASLDDAELLTATYEDWAVGEWIRTSVQSHFRASELDPNDHAVARTLRSYAFSGLVACFALDRLLAESQPDVLLLFNGRQSSTRVALELARARGIRTIAHERGLRHEAITLVENTTCLSLEHMRRCWQAWKHVPLSEHEVAEITGLMADREQGRNLPWMPLTASLQPLDEVRAELGLTPERPVWVLFTSSDDEVAGDQDWTAPFPSQGAWIARTIEHARRHPEIDLVIRVHPNTGSRRSSGANHKQLAELADLGADLPSNVQMVDPETEVSSYSLMELCTVGLTWVSTVGLELACKGKTVAVAAGLLRDTSFTRSVEDEGYEAVLDELIALAPLTMSREIRRLALRFAHGWFFKLRISFPLVHMPHPQQGTLTYTSLEALLPGRDAGLDRCTRIILDGEPVALPPTAADRARTTDAEDAALAPATPRLTALVDAADLLAEPTLLTAWAKRTAGRDDVTLLIHTPPELVEALVALVEAAGLGDEDGPDLVATEVDAATRAAVDLVLSREALQAAA